MATKLERLLVTLRTQLVAEEERAIAAGEIDDEPYFRNEPFPPASPAAIRRVEARLAFSFPPSYRELLRLHNGWRAFNGGDISVLGVSGRGYDRPIPAIARHEPRTLLAVFRDEVALHEKLWKTRPYRAGGVELRELDRRGTGVYFPAHPPVAVNLNGGCHVFVRHRQRKSGECPVAAVRFGTVEHEHATFTEFVAHWVRMTRA